MQIATQPFAVCSNNLDMLFTMLCKDIVENRIGASLLSFRCIVPSASIRAWLTLKLTSVRIPLLSGEILLLKEALELNQPSKSSLTSLFPSLVAFLHTVKNSQEYAPFFNRFGHSDPETVSSEHICSIAKKTLSHFALGLFLHQKTWFIKHKFEKLFDDFYLFAGEAKHPPHITAAPTFLFGFSSINQDAFCRLCNTFCIHKPFLLSPCMLFWGDLCSDNEIRNLLKKNASEDFEKAYEPFFLDRQKLLANSGHIGREFLNFLEDSNLSTSSIYTIQEELAKKNPYAETIPQEGIIGLSIKKTLLEHLKADLLLLISKRDTPENLLLDSSIEIHSAYTPLREVEALYEYLCLLYAHKSISPSSVLVLTTDLSRYKAPFEQVFGGHSFLFYHIFGEPQSKDLLSFLEILCSFFSSQGSKEDLLMLLRHEYFTNGFSLSPSDCDDVIQYILSISFFSVTCSQRVEYLKSKGIDTQHKEPSLQDHYEAKISSLFEKRSSEKIFEAPILTFFAQFFHYLETIQEIISLPIDPQKIEPLSLWLALLEAALAPYFLSDTTGTFDPVQQALSSLHSYNTHAPLSLSDTLLLFFAELKERFSLVSSALSSPIVLAEFGSFQPFPADVIAILGAEEGSLPKETDTLTDLHYLEKLPPTLYPSSTLFERYAFIEALISAKNFFIGFQSYQFDLREKIPYASPIADLVSHLDSNYMLDGKKPSEAILQSHPLHKKVTDKPVIPDRIEPIYGIKKEKAFTFSDILKAAKSPIDIYLSHTCGVATEWEDADSLFINPWEIRAHIEEHILHKKPFFKRDHALARQAYENSILEFSKTLHCLGISSFHSHTLEFFSIIDSLKTPEKNSLLSPLIHDLKHPFTGKIHGLFEEGMILFSESWKKELFQRWPEYILRAILSQEGILPLKERLLLIKEKKVISLSISCPKDLCSSWTEYAKLVTTVPFPFSFDTVSSLIKDPVVHHELLTKIQDSPQYPSLSTTYLKNMSLEDVEKYMTTWKKWAHLLYGDFFK